MKENIIKFIGRLFINEPEVNKKDFKSFILDKNYQHFFLLLVFSIVVSTIMLVLAKFSSDDKRIVYSNVTLLVFSVGWLFLFYLRRNKTKSDWLFFIPIIVLNAYASYLLGNFSYRGEFFSTYATSMFIIAIIYIASWQKIMIVFLSSMIYLYFFTKYVQGGPLSYSSVNIVTAFNTLFAAWFVSRLVYLSIRKEYENNEQIKQTLFELKVENQKNIKIVNELQDLKIRLEDTIEERTEALKKEKAKVELSDKAKSISLTNMSHKLRTPLSGVLGTLEMLKKKNISEEENELLLNMAVESTIELREIVDDIFDTGIVYDNELPVKTTNEIVIPEQKRETFKIEDIKRILIVEDNRINRFLLKKILEEKNYEIIEAENGEIAVKNYLQYEVDAVLMDIQMPVMDGYTALSKIRDIDQDKYVPVIAITGYTSANDKHDIIKSGFDGFLAKPFDKKNLLNLLEDFKNRGGKYGD